MGLFRRKRKSTCVHEWSETSTYAEPQYSADWTNGDVRLMRTETKSTIYCPKCATRRTVDNAEWLIIQREQEIRHKYKERIDAILRDPYLDDEEV